MKQIYLLFSKTKTLPSRLIFAIKGGKFTHVSLSLLPDTNEFYSYARRKIHNPLIGGFIVENIHSGILAKYPDSICSIYSLEVTDEIYENIENEIQKYKDNYDKAKYNLLGFCFLAFGIRWKRKYKLTCSQFVAVILDKTTTVQLPKDPYLMLPNDFLKIKELHLVYNGKISDCTIPVLMHS